MAVRLSIGTVIAIAKDHLVEGPSSGSGDIYRGPPGGSGISPASFSAFAGVTPETTVQVNELRLQAELQRLQQVNDNTGR